MASKYKIRIAPLPAGDVLSWSWTLYRDGSQVDNGTAESSVLAKAAAEYGARDLSRIERGTEVYDFDPTTNPNPQHWKV